jgi:RNA polymerase-binding transcription factor DksA
MGGRPDDLVTRLAAARDEAARRVEGLTRDFGAIVEEAALATPDDEHDPEGQTLGFERQQLAALLDAARGQVAALDAAIARARDGSYGMCARCGGTIAEERLAAIPTTTRCIACASRP